MPAATAVFLPIDKIEEFRKVAAPQRPWHFGKAIDKYYEFLESAGKRVNDFDWSGDYVVETFNYLKHVEMDMIASEYSELAAFLDKSRGGRHFVLTTKHQSQHLNRLQTMSYVESFLRHHFEQARGVEDPDAGRTMKDAMQFVCILLEDLPPENVAIISVE